MSFLQDCNSCQTDMSAEGRALVGCGWLAPVEGARPTQFDWMDPEGVGLGLTVCPGYTTKLPQVREAGRARIHWERGTLRDRYDGQELPPILLDALEVFEGAINELSAWRMRPKD